MQVVGDPYRLARPFNLFEAIPTALRIVWAELPRAMLLTLIFSFPAAVIQLVVGQGDDLRTVGNSVRASGFYELFIGTIGAQAVLALFIARGEGRVITLGQAMSEAMNNWGRAAGAIFRANLWILLFTLLLVIPGVWQAVMLLYARVAALRVRNGDALEASRQLVRGRFWPSFWVGAISFGMALGGIVFSIAAVTMMEALNAPPLATEFVSDVLTRLGGDVLSPALVYVAFVTLNVSAGTPVEPMRWNRELPYRQRNQS